MTTWFAQFLAQEPGFEHAVVERYTQRLLELARRKLPVPVQRRVDPEDVVQSVYRSFFQRLQAGQFRFEDSHDVWQLLAAMTFHKACNARIYHLRARRDARRDQPLAPPSAHESSIWEQALASPEDGDVNLLWECLERLLTGLPEAHRTIAALRLQGESIHAIATHVQRSQRTVLRVLGRLATTATAMWERESFR